MTAALSGEQRAALEKLVQNARKWIEADLEEAIEGRYGINAGGRIEPESSLSLTNSEAATRADLVDIVDFLRAEGEGEAGSVARLIREAAFTHTNRLIAVRVAEAIGLLPETMAKGVASSGFRDFSELAPTIAMTEWGRFAAFVRICADELASDVPALFDPRNPLLQLTMSEPVLAKVVAAMAEVDSSIWDAPDALGWTYQFFNSAAERKAMRDNSQAPTDSRELAVRNQFFTPSYVVDFLVQNTLGSRLSGWIPSLAEKLPLLLGPPPISASMDLEHVSVLDPACGSGHFLLGAYDLLEQAWRLLGYEPSDSAAKILASLTGIDIDPRAAQIAQVALLFRARRHGGGELPKPNVVCARALPDLPDAYLDTVPENVRRAIEVVVRALSDAPEMGALIPVDERIDTAQRDVFGTGIVAGTLAELVDLRTPADQRDLLDALARLADSTAASPAQRLFAAEAENAVMFVDALSQRYTVVLMNPPYGLAIDETVPQLQESYPNSWTDLYAAFVERGIGLLEPGGLVGALTSSSFFTGRKLREFRAQLLKSHRPTVLIDLGSQVLDGAANQTAMWVIPKQRSSGSTFFADLTGISVSERSSLIEVGELRVEERDPSAFAHVRNSPFAFHMPDSIAELWAEGRTLEPGLASVRSGCTTFDDFRFVRCWWEVGQPGPGGGWPSFEKGGDFQPYVCPTRLVLDWRDDGKELRAYAATKGTTPQVLQSSEWWRRPGLACPNISSIGFSSRLMAPGQVFSARTLAVFPNDDTETAVLCGLLNSYPVAEMLEVFGRSRTTDNGAVKAIPVPKSPTPPPQDALDLAFESALLVESIDEVSPLFDAVVLLGLGSPLVARSFLDDAIGAVSQAQLDIDMWAARVFGMVFDPSAHSAHAGLLDAWRRRVDIGDSQFWLARIASVLFGCLFGRYDPEAVERTQDWRRLIAEPMQLSSGRVSANRQGNGPALVSESGSEQSLGVTAAIGSIFRRINGTDDALMAAAGGSAKKLHAYVTRKFFAEHARHFSAAQRRAPIYWQLQVPSKTWGLWLYAPELSRELLFAIVRESEQRKRLAEQQIAHLQREADSGSGGRKASEVAKELEAERKLSVELESFRAEAERIANLGWEPDLADGMVLNAAPLAGLFPAWKNAANCRTELRAGKYAWATVAQFADRL